MSEFVFRASDHTYFLDGEQLPSLSDLLRPLTESKYQDIPNQDNLEARRQRGVDIHKDIELWCLGELDRYATPAVEAFVQWCDDSGFVPDRIEEPTYHTVFRYGCTADMLGTLKDGSQLLVDIKTGSKAAWHPVQLGGYASALASQDLCSERVARGNLYILPSWKAASYDWCPTKQPARAQALALTFAQQQAYGAEFGLDWKWFTPRSYE